MQSAEEIAVDDVTVEYDGPALDHGLIDVSDLAPSILGFSQLCQRVDELENYGRTTLRVQIKAQPKQGSVAIDFHFVHTAISTAHALVENQDVKELTEVLETVGIYAGAASAVISGVLQLGRKLRGRSPENVLVGDKVVVVNLENGETLYTTPGTWRAWIDRQVRRSTALFTQVLKTPGFKEIRFRRGAKTEQRITNEDALFLTEPADQDAITDEESIRLWEVRTVTTDPTLQWKFFEGQKTRINAHMIDSIFVRKLAGGDQGVITGDLLKVRVRSVSKLSARGKVVVENFIVEVIEVIRRPQISLLSSDIDALDSIPRTPSENTKRLPPPSETA